ncbi:MAG: hypothetical protein C0599_17395 [Salinivirgaceae bacterium]|nr:MAG: hypothetical protein C0599_17395 [Salinivirgaceae bacterium]
MENYIILGGLVLIFVLVLFLLFEIFKLKRKIRETEVETLEQINLTIKSIDTEVQELKKNVYTTLDKK